MQQKRSYVVELTCCERLQYQPWPLWQIQRPMTGFSGITSSDFIRALLYTSVVKVNLVTYQALMFGGVNVKLFFALLFNNFGTTLVSYKTTYSRHAAVIAWWPLRYSEYVVERHLHRSITRVTDAFCFELHQNGNSTPKAFPLVIWKEDQRCSQHHEKTAIRLGTKFIPKSSPSFI